VIGHAGLGPDRFARHAVQQIELLIRTTRNTKALIYLDDELVEERRF